ncbi:MAG: aldehyde dehydrogenase family protein [Deltaproteobacteria bacterium]|nr:aldehyde dehydrogenase family protein [Deltaproteobacteria bacterium]
MSQPAAVLSGSAKIPEAEGQLPPTSREEIDAALTALSAKKDDWVALTLVERVRILERLADATLAASPRWVQAALKAKGITPGTVGEGEEWIAGPVPLMRNIMLLIRSLTDIARKGNPQLPGKAYARPDGQVVAPVFPTDTWDKLMYQGFTAEVWMDPEVSLAELPSTQAAFYRDPPEGGKVALVLGAGNVSSIGPMDALYKLFVEGQVAVLKMNPVNAYLGPFIEEGFAELISRGFLRVVQGGAAEGEYLCNHPEVEEIHITGSDKTHDAIVYGTGSEGAERKARRERRNARRITSELGNVSGIIVVPGPWSRSDIDFQGLNLASSLTNNAGFNCNATRVVIQHRQWGQRDALLDAIERGLAQAPQREPYYPGALQRHAAFVEAHPDARQVGRQGEGKLPWTLVAGVAPEAVEDICFTTEAFCAVTSETALSAGSVVEYIEKAVDFVNDTLWGTLNAAIIVHPKSLKDPAVKAAVEKAVADLRAGAVAVNHWPALAYAFTSPTWGAFPGHEDHDIRSGRGVVHNTYLFDRPQKSVVRGPFRVSPKPAWFCNHKTIHRLGPKLAEMTRRPTMAKLSSILLDALRG